MKQVLVWMLGVCLLFASAGCKSATGNSSSRMDGALDLSFNLATEVPLVADHFQIVGLDRDGKAIFGPTYLPKAAVVKLTGVPIGVTKVEVSFLIGTTPLGMVSASVDLSSGSAMVDFGGMMTTAVEQLQSLTVSPASAEIAVRGVQDFHVSGRFSDGASYDLTTLVAWLSSAPAVASADAGGRVTGVTAGTTDIRASLGSVVSNSAQLTVTAPVEPALLPTITSVTPSEGPEGGGTMMTIVGTNLLGATAVSFGSTPASSFEVDTDTQIVATSPAGTAGIVNLQVSTPKGTSTASDAGRFSYFALPVVQTVTPLAGKQAGGESVVIIGRNFNGATSVKFGGNAATSFTVDSSTQITATAPSGAGLVNVIVANGKGSSAVSASARYRYLPIPVLASLDPGNGPETGGNPVVLTGSGLSEVTAVMFGGTLADFVIVSDTKVTATAPAGTGTVRLTVRTPGGTSEGLDYAFLPIPALTDLEPLAGPEAGGNSVKLLGSGLVGATGVKFGELAATSYDVVSDTELDVVAPAGTGTARITVVTSGGISNALDYRYAVLPTLGSASSTVGPLDGGNPITLTGSGFSDATAVRFGAVAASSLVVVSDTELTLIAPPGSGTVEIKVVTPGGLSTGVAYQYLPIPALTSVAPALGAQPGGALVTLIGSGLDDATAVNFGALPALSFTVSSNTQITATVPAGTGAVPVSVVTPGGTTNVLTYTYLAAPTLDAVVPTEGPLQGGNPVLLTGSHFTSASEVRFGALQAASFTIVSDTQIEATAPAGTDSVMITVVTPGGVSNEQAYGYVPGPALVGVAPASGPEAGGTTVVLSGGDFTGTTGVDFGSTPATSFTVVSAGRIDAIAPEGTGAVDVTVTNAGGTSNTSVYTYVARPELDALTPAGGSSVGGTPVTITGVHLTDTNEVHFGTIPATSFTVVSDNEIIAIAAPGTGVVEVSVRTAGGVSEVLPYTYTTILPVIAALAPSSGPLIGGNDVTILGSGFSDVTTVTFGGNSAPFTFVSDTEITTTAPAGSGVLDVLVTTPSGVSNPFPYAYVAAPSLVSVLPGSSLQAGGASVALVGTGFTGTTAVSFGSAPAAQFSVVSDTQITAVAPPGTGTVSLTLTTPGGISNALPFSYFPPTAITSVTPDAGPASGATLVTIQGVSFTDVSAVLFGATPAAFSTLSDTQIEAIAPAGLGSVIITVIGPAGVASSSYTYLPPPLVTSLTPAAGPATGGNTVTIGGSGLSLATQVFFGSTPAPFSVVSDAELSVIAPAGTSAVDLTVVSTGGTSTISAAYSYVQAPNIAALSPEQGPIAGGTSVLITGTELATASAVSFGGVPGSLLSITPTSIEVSTPAFAAGDVDVVVTTLGGSATVSGAFTYVPLPVLASLAPSAGPTTGGDTVTITGSDLSTASAVSFDGVPGSITSVTATTVTVTTPANAPSTALVVVTTAGGDSNALSYQYVASPTIATASPGAGPTAGGTVVTLAGNGFTNATSVTFGGVPATSFTVDSDTQITAIAPANASLTQIVVTSAGGVSNGVSFNYVAPPVIVGVSPTTGPQIGGNTVTIAGSSFTGATSVTFGGAPAPFVILSDTQLLAAAPAGIGSVDLVVTSVGGSATAIAAYRYVGSATLASITPDLGAIAGGNSVVITGADLLDVLAVSFGGAGATITSASSTSLTVTVPAGAPGASSVVATTLSGSSNALTYTYVAPPVLDNVTPSTGPEAGGNAVLLDGEALDLVTSVQFGGLDASFTVVSDQQLSAQLPAGVGVVDVTVTNLAGSDTLVGAYEYVPAPSLNTISPTVGGQAGGTTVTITGTNLLATESVLFGATPAASFTAVSPTTVIASSPAGTGIVDVTLGSAGGSATLTGAFRYAGTPAITSLSPTAGPAGGGNTLTITGSDLESAMGVHFLGFGVVPVASASATQVTLVVPGLAGGATYNISVLTAGGESNTLPYSSVTPPLISAITPSAGPVLGGTSVAIFGTGFTSTDQVTLDGVPATSFTVDHAGQITAVTPAGAAGAVDVVVTNAGGSSTSVGGFTYLPTPGLGALSAAGGTVAGGETVTLTGTNFAGATGVLFGGASAPNFTVISPTQIVAVTPVGVEGGINVTVVTPGGTSNALSFDYVDPPVLIGITPASGPLAGGNTISIDGLDLETTYAVLVDGVTASFTVIDDEELTVTVPAGIQGYVDVEVQTLGGSSTASSSYNYVPASDFVFSPNMGREAGGDLMTLNGIYLAGVTDVKFGNASATFQVVSPVTLNVTTPPGTGVVDITVTTPGGSTTKPAAFTYEPIPTISSVSPNVGPTAGGVLVTITGTGLTNAQVVAFGNNLATPSSATPTQVTVFVPAGISAGATNVVVSTPGGDSNSLSFTYVDAPSLSSVSPASGSTAGGNTVVLSGSALSGTTAVTFDGVPASFTIISDSQIDAIAPAGSPGAVDIVVTSAGGSATASSAYTYAAAPALGTLLPNAGAVSGGTAITALGTNLWDVTAVTVDGTPAVFVVVSPTQLAFSAPASSGPGAATVMVTNAGGTSNGLTFTYVTPVSVVDIQPAVGPESGGDSVVFDGDDFTTVQRVLFDGIDASFTVDSDEQLTVIAPAGFGTVAIEIVSAAGSETFVGAYTYIPPAFFTVLPSVGRESGGETITLFGSNLYTTTDVLFGSTPAASFTVDSDTQLTVLTPAGTGATDVTVITPGGTSTEPGGFIFVPPPVTTSLSAASGPSSGGNTLFITGSELDTTTTVLFNGVPGGVTSATSTQVAVIVPASTPTTATVEVITAGGSASNLSYEWVDGPTITVVSPTQGSTAGGTSVTISGSSLSSTTAVYFDGTPASFTVISSTQLTATTPAGASGAVDVVVENPGGSATAVSAFSYLPTPTLSGIAPTYGPVAGGTNIALGGSNFIPGATSVSFGGAASQTVNVLSSTLLSAALPAHAAGPVSVTVTTAGGTTGAVSFNYVNAPTITSISPNSGDWFGDYFATITGTNLTSVTAVYFGLANPGYNITVVSDNQLQVMVPSSGTLGAVDVSVETAGGIATASGAFTFTP